MTAIAVDRGAFFAALRARFGPIREAATVRAIECYLDECRRQGVTDLRQVAYVLATVRHETGARMYPVRETFAKSDAEAIRRLAGADYARPAGPYGHVYFGRGGIQTTWIDNYRKLSEVAGVDLVKYPGALLEPEVSARCDVHGMVHGHYRADGAGRQTLARHFPPGGVAAWFQARDIINGDKHRAPKWAGGKKIGTLIAGYARDYHAALVAAAEVAPPDVPAPKVPAPAGRSVGVGRVLVFAAVVAVLAALAAAFF